MDDLDTVIDASEAVLSKLASNAEVAYAEVGGVRRWVTDAVVTADRVRSANDLTDSGVWWRVFVDGSADYRYLSTLEETHLDELLARSIRSATLLDQRSPARYDRGTVHRAVHPGWAIGSPLDAQSADEKAEQVRTALVGALDDRIERARVPYRDERIEMVLLTTLGTTLNTTLERVSVEPTVVPVDGPKHRLHAGSTTGTAFLRTLPDCFEELSNRAETAADLPETPLDATGRRDVVFGPEAAAELFHQLSHYLEIDSVYLGSSPYSVGDRIGPPSLSIEDTVRAGSWAALAFDAEGRPTQPVSLVTDGTVTDYLYDTSAAIEENAFPAGNVVPSLGFEQPPRVHARHLDIAPGSATVDELRDGADVYVERVGRPHLVNEATRTKRASGMPGSTLYAKDVQEMTPSEFDTEATTQRIRLPVTHGYTLRAGERIARLVDTTIEFSLADFESLTAVGGRRDTLTGTCTKHGSTLPFAVTAPAIRLSVRLRGE